jgi:hypothetical protein
MTLVFAKERTKESLREAMFDNRTVAWFGDKMIGRENILVQLFEASLEVQKTNLGDEDELVVKVKNVSEIPFQLSDDNGYSKTIPALGETFVTLPGANKSFRVTNLITGTEEVLETELPL